MKSSLLALFVLTLLLPLTVWGGTAPPPTIPAVRPDPKAVTDFSRSLVRVNSTVQGYDFMRPWAKKSPSTRRGTGVVVGTNRVLVTAAMVANHTFVEFERPTSGERVPAEVVAVDYECNLALLAATDPKFLENAQVLHLDETARVGSAADILQLEPNGDIAPTAARITTITVAPYALEDIGFLVFRVTAPIQQRDGSFVLPVVRDGRLLGLVMRYDGRNQTADVIPPPIIRRFLETAETNTQAAFPRAGVGLGPLRDPQLRRYLGIDKREGGILITKVDPRGAADKAGVLAGDVVLAVDDQAVDSDGNFQHPEYGRIPLSYLITTSRLAGNKVNLTVLRNGAELQIPVTLERRDVDKMSVPSYLIDRQPTYLIAGGFIFQELTRSFLQEWGPEWRANAPQRLVHADLFQDELRPGGEKVVVLSGVLPAPATLGYEGLSGLIVESIDGEPVTSLRELANRLTAPGQRIHELTVDQDPRLLYLDSQVLRESGPQIARHYGIPQLANLDGKKPATAPAPPAPSTPAENSDSVAPDAHRESAESPDGSTPAEGGAPAETPLPPPAT